MVAAGALGAGEAHDDTPSRYRTDLCMCTSCVVTPRPASEGSGRVLGVVAERADFSPRGGRRQLPLGDATTALGSRSNAAVWTRRGTARGRSRLTTRRTLI